MEPAEKVRENRLRRMAERQGLCLHKSRRRDPRAIDYGGYWLVDVYTGSLIAGDPGIFALNIDEVETYLTSETEG